MREVDQGHHHEKEEKMKIKDMRILDTQLENQESA